MESDYALSHSAQLLQNAKSSSVMSSSFICG